MEAIGEQAAAKLYPKDPVPRQANASPGPAAPAVSSLEEDNPTPSPSSELQLTAHPAARPPVSSSLDGPGLQDVPQPAQADAAAPQSNQASIPSVEGPGQDPQGADVQVAPGQHLVVIDLENEGAEPADSAAPPEQQISGKDSSSDSQAIQPVQLQLGKQANEKVEGQQLLADGAGADSKAAVQEHVTVELVTAPKAGTPGQENLSMARLTSTCFKSKTAFQLCGGPLESCMQGPLRAGSNRHAG